MQKDNLIELKKLEPVSDLLTETLRLGARQLLKAAIEAEVKEFMAEHNSAEEKARFVRNGYLPEREIQTGIGNVAVQMPRVRDRQVGETKIRFGSSIIPKYLRRSAECEGDESLLDLAATRYADSRSSTKKASLLRCIEILIAHGSRLTSQAALKSLNWAALSKILPYVSAPTRRVAATQVALLEYAKESEQQVKSFWWRFFHSSGSKNKRCETVRAIVSQFFADPELPLAQQERDILEATAAAERNAKPKFGGSGLFNALVATRQADETQPLLAPGDNELRSIKAALGRYGSTN